MTSNPISAAENSDLDVLHTAFDTNFTWNYGTQKEGLRALYEKAKTEQWNGAELAWDSPVEPEGDIIPQVFNPLQDYAPYKKLSAKEKARFKHGQLAWTLSQFLHGEQGALMAASQLVTAVPWMDAKYYAATQTVDEARHVEAFARTKVDDTCTWYKTGTRDPQDVFTCIHRGDPETTVYIHQTNGGRITI